MQLKTGHIVACYIGANVAANLLVNSFGQVALVCTAFALIPFDLAARDTLHERWSGDRLALRMFALVSISAALTFAANTGAIRVAVASAVAFALSATGDTVIYQMLRTKRPFVKMNASNVAGAIIDSVAFPLIAFGGLSATLSASQAALKIAGGAIWSFALARTLYRSDRSGIAT